MERLLHKFSRCIYCFELRGIFFGLTDVEGSFKAVLLAVGLASRCSS